MGLNALIVSLAVLDTIIGVLGEWFNQFCRNIFSGVSLIAMIMFAFIISGYLYVTCRGYQNVIAQMCSAE